MKRAIDWVLSMQCKNGGWASFDKDNNRMVFQYIPFADHNAMLDPATVDITGRVLECLAAYGFTLNDKPVKRAIKFIRSQQESDGSWFGRWGVNYIYGTMCVLRGLDAIGFDNHEAMVQQAAEWIRMMQNPDGGWGESCDSYDDRKRKEWARAPLADRVGGAGFDGGGDFRRDSVARGIAYLLDSSRTTAAGSKCPTRVRDSRAYFT